MLKLIAGLALGWGAAEWYKRRKAKGPADDPGDKWGGTYTMISKFVGGATSTDNPRPPLVVLLHGQASNPLEALSQFALERPAQVVVPLGQYRHGDDGRFSYVDPNLAGDARDKALRDEVGRLAKAIDAFAADAAPVPRRAIVVGLDASGPLAAALALTDPLNVRYAWATGGVFPPAWVPAKMPLLNNLQKPVVYKLSYGDAVPVDEAAAKLANSLGMPFNVTVVNGVPTTQAWLDWMLPELEPLLLTP